MKRIMSWRSLLAIFIVSVTVTVAALIFTLPASAAEYSGTCGTDVSWSLDAETGILSITGTGDMKDYSWLTSPWNSYNSVIKTVSISNGVTSIGDYAFYNCTNLQSIEIPSSVTSIGDYAFYYCTNLQSIEIPSSVTTIEGAVFQGCYSLASIELSYGLNYIGWGAFQDCDDLISINIPSSVNYIGDYAFSYCDNLASIEIPSSVDSLGSYVLAGCSNLTSITVDEYNVRYYSSGNCLIETDSGVLVAGCRNSVIPADGSVTVIGDGAFNNCYELVSIDIPYGITEIRWGAFQNCSNLTSINIPSSVNYIGDYAFSNCYNLTSIEIPSSVDSLGSYVLAGCSNLTSITVDENNQKYYSSGNCLIDTYSGVLVAGCRNSVIPADGSVTVIGDGAFNNCYELVSIDIPYGVNEIRWGAFQNCSNLTSINIPSSVNYIGDYAFSNCYDLASIDIPSSVISIGRDAFSGCSMLMQYEGGIYYVDKWAVDCDQAAYEVTLRSDTEGIAGNSFENCLFTSIDIPSSVKRIGDYAFYYCTSLTSMTFGENSQLKSIGDYAFYYCTNLQSIDIPSGVTSIGNGAFYGCTSLSEVYNCSSLEIILQESSHGFVGYYAKALYIHKYSGKMTINDATHYYECLICDNIGGEAEHEYSHSFMSSGDNTHNAACICGKTELQGCAGGTATCIEQAVCEMCGVYYAQTDSSNHAYYSEYLSNGNNIHSATCICGHVDTQFCRGGVATCTEKAVCEICSTSYGRTNKNNHNYSDVLKYDEYTHFYECILCQNRSDDSSHSYTYYTSNEDSTHSATCICGYIDTKNCSGGEATCMDRAICEICKSDHGDVDTSKHSYSMVLKSGEATHYFECSNCFNRRGEGNHSFYKYTSNGDGTHSSKCICGKVVSQKCSGGVATCSDKAFCEVCGDKYGEYSKHDYTIQKYDWFSHWTECECGQRSDVEDHRYRTSNTCMICGYEEETEPEKTTEEETEEETESETEADTVTESDTEKKTESEKKTEKETHAATEPGKNQTTEEETKRASSNASGSDISSCLSSVSGGTLTLTSVLIFGVLMLKRKKED